MFLYTFSIVFFVTTYIHTYHVTSAVAYNYDKTKYCMEGNFGGCKLTLAKWQRKHHWCNNL